MKTVVRKRVVAGLSVLGGALFSFGGCGPQSPTVGEETGTGGSGGSSGSSGSNGAGGSLVGDVSFFVKGVGFADPSVSTEVTCLPRKLPVNDDGSVACAVISARFDGACTCEGPARRPWSGERGFIEQELASVYECGDSTGIDCGDVCLCEEAPATGASADDCLNRLDVAETSFGWCYVDPDAGRGSPEFVEDCPDTQRQILRSLSAETAAAGSKIVNLVACSGGSAVPGRGTPGPAGLGEACIPRDEYASDFNGFSLSDVSLDFGTPACESNLCLVNHFQGRVSCPYGQTPGFPSGTDCKLPNSNDTVSVPVDAQLAARRAEDNVICSCRCDGPEPSAAYCACPQGMECAPLVHATGLPGENAYVGSYCIPQGTRFDPANRPDPYLCYEEELNCGDPTP
jgi:hypothetical protein